MNELLRAALDVIKAWDGMQIAPNSDSGVLAMANLRTAIALIKVDKNELGGVHVPVTGDGTREGLGICVR